MTLLCVYILRQVRTGKESERERGRERDLTIALITFDYQHNYCEIRFTGSLLFRITAMMTKGNEMMLSGYHVNYESQ